MAWRGSYHRQDSAIRYVGSELFLTPNISSCLQTNHRFNIIISQKSYCFEGNGKVIIFKTIYYTTCNVQRYRVVNQTIKDMIKKSRVITLGCRQPLIKEKDQEIKS